MSDIKDYYSVLKRTKLEFRNARTRPIYVSEDISQVVAFVENEMTKLSEDNIIEIQDRRGNLVTLEHLKSLL